MPSDTLEKWDEYVQEYESGMNQAQQDYGNMSNPDKQSNAEDIAKQKAYLEWLKSKSAEFHEMEQQGQEIPATVSLNNAGMGVGFYTWGDDSTTYRTGYLHTFTATQNADIISAEHFHLVLQEISIHPYDGSSWLIPPGYDDYYGVYWEWTTIESRYTPSGSESVGTRYQLNRAAAGSEFKYVDTTGNLQASPYTTNGGSGRSWWVSVQARPVGQIPHFDNTTELVCYGNFVRSPYLGNVITVDLDDDDIDTSKPWDYYNNDLLPNINPDIAAFPGGYNPEPTKPDPEPPEIEGEEENGGDDIELNDPSGIGGGFGFVTQYCITGAQITELGRKLWNGFSDITDYMNNFVYRVDPNTGSVNFADIMEFFISLKVYPFPLGNVAAVSAAGQNMYIGSGAAPIPFSSNLHTMDEFVAEMDCGTLSIPFWYGDYRDYELQIVAYLPYCGTAELNPGDVMGGTLSCKYYVDFSTGACIAYITCTTWDGHELIVATLPGQMGADIPLTASNANNIMARMYGDRLNVAENFLSSAKSAASGITAVLAGNVGGAVRAGISTFFDTDLHQQQQNAAIGERGAISAPMLSGGRGLAAFGSPTAVYVQIRTPFYAVPENYAQSVGDPASSAVTIGDCTGFCQFVNVDVSGIVTDAADQAAIRQALAAGVYV